MRRIILLSFSIFLVLFVATGASGVLGYYSHKLRLEPIYGLAERAEAKGRKVFGLPSETVAQVASVETIYLRLKGKVYPMPDNDFRNGGGLTAWDGDVLVVNRSGVVFYLDEDKGLVPSAITVPDNGEEAYARIAAEKYPGRPAQISRLRYNDIEFIDEGNLRGFVLSYTFVDGEKECYGNRVAWLPVPDSVASIRDLSTAPEDWEVVYQSSPCLEFNASRELMVAYMAGGRVAFKAPNLLYLGNGEFHREGFYRPDVGIQDDNTDYGKTIEINLETREARHYSKGHRNLQGVEIDKLGRLWTTEHGMRGGDELNLIKDGENYGWPLENLGTLYSKVPAPTEGRVGRHEIYRAPVYAWLPSAAVSALALVDGFDETWDGDLLVASLKGRTLYRARIRDERIVFLEEIYIGQRIRDVMQVDEDRIALWLDFNELVIFTKEERVDPLDGLAEALAAQGMPQERVLTVTATLEGCAECHSYEENVQGAGPSLYGIYENSIAATAFADYSAALRAQPGVWDAERLKAYLEKPETIVPDSPMTGLGVGDPQAAEDLVAAFEWLKTKQQEIDPGQGI